MTSVPTLTIEEAAAPRAMVRADDLKPLPAPEAVPEPPTAVLSKGGNCHICYAALLPGTPLDRIVWCARHRAWRCTGCFLPPSAGGDPWEVSPQTPLTRRAGRGAERRCTCTPTLSTARARAKLLRVTESPAGAAVEIEIRFDDGIAVGARVFFPGRKGSTQLGPEAARRLGAAWEGA